MSTTRKTKTRTGLSVECLEARLVPAHLAFNPSNGGPVTGVDSADLGPVLGTNSINNTVQNWKVSNGDLGSFIEKDGHLYTVFGDSYGSVNLAKRDADVPDWFTDWRSNVMAEVDTSAGYDGGLKFKQMIADPQKITDPPTPKHAKALIQGDHQSDKPPPSATSEVTKIPTYGFAVGGTMYLQFMSVHHWALPATWTTNYSKLAKSVDNGQNWQVVNTGPTWNSASNFAQVAVTRNNTNDGYLYFFGIKAGRFGLRDVPQNTSSAGVPQVSDIELARVREADVDFADRYQYLHVDQNQSRSWVTAESQASKVASGPVSELSVVWNPYLGRWLMAYTDIPGNVMMQTAASLTGPWTDPQPVVPAGTFSGAYGAFMAPSLMKDGGRTIYLAESNWAEYNVHLVSVTFTSGLTYDAATREVKIDLKSGTTSNNGVADTVNIRGDNGTMFFTVNNQSWQYPLQSVSKVTLIGSAHTDNVTLNRARVPVTVTGGGGNDTLTVDETGGPALSNLAYAVASGSVTVSTITALASLNLTTVNFSGVNDVRFVMPSTVNTVTVTGLPAKLTVKATTSGSLAANNTVTVNTAALTNARTVDFQGGTADDKLVISDNAGAGGTTTINFGRIDVQPAPIANVATPGGSVTFTGAESVAVTGVHVTGKLGVAAGRNYVVAGWGVMTPLSVTGADGADRVILGAAGGLAALAAPAIPVTFLVPTISVDGGGGGDTLVYNDAAAATGMGLDVVATYLSRHNGSSGIANLYMPYSRFTAIQTVAGSGNDYLSVFSLPSGTRLDSSLGAGDDQAVIGTATVTGLTALINTITIDGVSGTDGLVVNDQTNAVRRYTVQTSGLSASAFVGSFLTTVGTSRLASVRLNTGTAADTVTITGTPAGTAYTVATGGGNDTVNVDLGKLVAPMSLVGGPGTNSLNVSDTNPDSYNYVITADALASNSVDVPAYYSDFSDVVVTGTDRPENFYIDATAAGTRYTLRGRDGYDGYNFGYSTGTLDYLQGSVAVNDTLGQCLVMFEDINNPDPHSFTLGATARSALAFQRDGIVDVDLSLYGDPNELAFLYLDTGLGVDAVNIQALPAEYYSVNYLTEGDTFVIGSDPTGQFGDMRDVHGRVDVRSDAPVTVIADDSADTEARDVYVENGIYGAPEAVYVDGMAAYEMTFSVAAGSNVWLRGGQGDDRFRILDDIGVNPVSVDACDGVDTLDYSWGDYFFVPFNNGVYVDLEGTTATGLNQAVGFENVVGSVGNDIILGNAADNLILGMSGDDTLIGRGGNDILIGGYGNDWLVGGEGDDLLIGGATAYDTYVIGYFGIDIPLSGIQTEWSRTDIGYYEKLAHITGDAAGGLNVGVYLTNDHVDDADQADWLTGDQGADWFFGRPDTVWDLEDGERVG